MSAEKKKLPKGIIKEIADELGQDVKKVYYQYFSKNLQIMDMVASKLEARKKEEKRIITKIENLMAS